MNVEQDNINVHPLSDVLTDRIGSNTTIWQFCVILSGVNIGNNCNICSHVFIESNVKIGNSVTIKNGTKIFDGVNIGNEVFVGPNVTFTNDRYPVSQRSTNKKVFSFEKTFVADRVSIGAGCTILSGVNIGEGARIGAGSVITKDVPAWSTVKGNPAK